MWIDQWPVTLVGKIEIDLYHVLKFGSPFFQDRFEIVKNQRDLVCLVFGIGIAVELLAQNGRRDQEPAVNGGVRNRVRMLRGPAAGNRADDQAPPLR